MSYAGFSICPMHNRVSQGPVVGSQGEPIHADGFDSTITSQGSELTSSPNIPPGLLNHSSATFGCTNNFHGPDGTVAVLCKPASFGYLPRPQDHSGARPETFFLFFAPNIQSLKTVKFAFLASLD